MHQGHGRVYLLHCANHDVVQSVFFVGYKASGGIVSHSVVQMGVPPPAVQALLSGITLGVPGYMHYYGSALCGRGEQDLTNRDARHLELDLDSE